MKNLNAPILVHPIRSAKKFFERHHLIRSAKEFFQRRNDRVSDSWSKSIFGRFTAFSSTSISIMAAVLLLAQFRYTADAKPGPFYNSSSAFSYVLMTPTDGMYGEKTNFWVKEAGLSYKVPSLKFEDVSITPVLMGLVGNTRAEGLPPAETNFWKAALIANITYGKSTLGLGARGIGAQSLPWSFKAGPKTITIPSENYFDLDLGAKYKYRAGRTDTAGFIRSASAEVTRFNARWTIRAPYYVAKGSVDFPKGWGTDFFYDSRDDNFGIGANKTFVWGMGEKMLFLGGGYEFQAKSVSGYVGGAYKDVMALAIYQTEGGVPSYHLLLNYNLAGLYDSVFGSGQK